MTAFDRSHYDYIMFKEYGIPDFSKLPQEERNAYETEEQEKEESLIYMAENCFLWYRLTLRQNISLIIIMFS